MRKRPQRDVKNNASTGPVFLRWAGLVLPPIIVNFNLYPEDALSAVNLFRRLPLFLFLLRIDLFPFLLVAPLVPNKLCY